MSMYEVYEVMAGSMGNSGGVSEGQSHKRGYEICTCSRSFLQGTMALLSNRCCAFSVLNDVAFSACNGSRCEMRTLPWLRHVPGSRGQALNIVNPFNCVRLLNLHAHLHNVKFLIYDLLAISREQDVVIAINAAT